MTVAASSGGDKFEGSHATDLRSATPAQSAVTFSTASLLLGKSVNIPIEIIDGTTHRWPPSTKRSRLNFANCVRASWGDPMVSNTLLARAHLNSWNHLSTGFSSGE